MICMTKTVSQRFRNLLTHHLSATSFTRGNTKRLYLRFPPALFTTTCPVACLKHIFCLDVKYKFSLHFDKYDVLNKALEKAGRYSPVNKWFWQNQDSKGPRIDIDLTQKCLIDVWSISICWSLLSASFCFRQNVCTRLHCRYNIIRRYIASCHQNVNIKAEWRIYASEN